MNNTANEKEIEALVSRIISDYDGNKNIDETDYFDKPDKAEVIELVNNMFRIIYPGYFKDRSHKIYNPKSSLLPRMYFTISKSRSIVRLIIARKTL